MYTVVLQRTEDILGITIFKKGFFLLKTLYHGNILATLFTLLHCLGLNFYICFVHIVRNTIELVV